jgi:hypothetical protein
VPSSYTIWSELPHDTIHDDSGEDGSPINKFWDLSKCAIVWRNYKKRVPTGYCSNQRYGNANGVLEGGYLRPSLQRKVRFFAWAPVMTALAFAQYIKVQRADALVRANKMFRTSQLLQELPGEMEKELKRLAFGTGWTMI